MNPFDKKSAAPVTFADALMQGLSPAGWAPERSEKAAVFESLSRFAQEQLARTPGGTVSFPGGELSLKSTVSQDVEFVSRFSSFDTWQKAQQERLGARIWQALSQGKKEPLVLFVGDTLLSDDVLAQSIQGIQEEFLLSFNPLVAELFQKMVQAMKLAPGEYVISALKDAVGDKSEQELLEEVFWWSPHFVVPLGAMACQAFLGTRERLASVHGKFFPLSLRAGKSISVAPLFHPSVIASNVNMKKATWSDMQKIMRALGKV